MTEEASKRGWRQSAVFRFLACGMTLTVLTCGGCLFLGFLSKRRYRVDFDSTVWIEHPEYRAPGRQVTVRQSMLDDLLTSGLLDPDASKEEVRSLIGPPDKSTPEGEGVQPSVVYISGLAASDGMASRWFYRIGLERHLFPMDNEWLLIDFDDQGRLIEARRYTD